MLGGAGSGCLSSRGLGCPSSLAGPGLWPLAACCPHCRLSPWALSALVLKDFTSPWSAGHGIGSSFPTSTAPGERVSSQRGFCEGSRGIPEMEQGQGPEGSPSPGRAMCLHPMGNRACTDKGHPGVMVMTPLPTHHLCMHLSYPHLLSVGTSLRPYPCPALGRPKKFC